MRNRPAVLLLALLALLPAATGAYRAADPTAPVLDAANVFDHERFWPYRVRLTAPFEIEGREKPIRPGTGGVLVRLRSAEVATIDFGRDGLRDVAVSDTNLIDEANAIRRGERDKVSPNLVHAIGPRLVDTAAAVPAKVDFEALVGEGVPGMLEVFARPEAIPELARELAPLHGRHGVWTVFYPHGEPGSVVDARVRKQLREAGWPVPFLEGYLAMGYSRSRRVAESSGPSLQIETSEGRLIYAGAFRPGIASELAERLDAAFGPGER